jgi:hypothetical protein
MSVIFRLDFCCGLSLLDNQHFTPMAVLIGEKHGARDKVDRAI